MISNDYNVNLSPSFQARLNFNDIRIKDSKKAQKVQRLFEEKTQHYKSGQLDLKRGVIERDNGSFFHNVDISSEEGGIGFICTMKDFNKWFSESSAENLAKQLVRVYKFGKLRVQNAVTENRIARNLRSAKFTRDKYANGVEGFAEKYKALSDSIAKRVQKLQETLDSTKQRNQDLEQQVLEPVSGRIFLESDFDR